MDADTTANVTPTPNVPSSWPGAFGIFKYSKRAVQRNAWSVVGIIVLYILISALSGSTRADKGNGSFDAGTLIGTLVSIFLGTALTFIMVAGARGNKMGLGEAFKKSLPLYLKALGLNILTAIISVLSIVLFIIPAFFIIPRLELAAYYLVDKKLGPIDSIKASWNATKGNVGKVWGIFGANILFGILVLVLVGIYFLIMYMAASAILYAFIEQNRASTNEMTQTTPAEQTTDVSAPTAPIAS